MLENENYAGLTIRYEQDEDAQNPREEFDNFGTMVCFHSRYNLGDKHEHKSPDGFLDSLAEKVQPGFAEYWDIAYGKMVPLCNQASYQAKEKAWSEARGETLWKILDRHCIMLPLYLYDHSGITISTGPFSCPWDSGQVGWIYATREAILKEYGGALLTVSKKERTRTVLEAEVKIYDAWLTGSVYGYVVKDEEGKHLDSCWGFFITDQKDWEYLQTEARQSAQYHADNLVKENAKRFTVDTQEQIPA